jgi:hypothetical protein
MSNSTATPASRTLRFAVTTALISMSTAASSAACTVRTNPGPQEPMVNEGPAIDPATPTDPAGTDDGGTPGDAPKSKLDVRPTGEQTPTPTDGGPAPDGPPPVVSVNPGPNQPPPPTTPPKPQPKPKVMVNPGPSTAPTTTKPEI